MTAHRTACRAFSGALMLAGLLLLAMSGGPAVAQQQAEIIPDAWKGDVVPDAPDLSQVKRLRFVTDSDYPPFQYYDEEGVLTGFNVDLAQAICEVLEVECDVQQVDWDNLFETLESGEADAAVASLRIDERNLAQADFTQRYYATPARFIGRKDDELTDTSPEALAGRRIAVIEGTGHEAYLRSYFKTAKLVTFSNADAALAALKAGDADLVFGDGIALTFWLNGVTSDGCCEFRGGPYLDAKYFGEGVGIAVAKGDRRMAHILDYALHQLRAEGRLEELFLRYFPMNFF
jgi:polar amino acid transport system substrate-binding protein